MSAQALIFPLTLALLGARIDRQHTGAGMGLIGTMKNADKVIGPVLGGLLVHWQDFSWMLWTMAGLPAFGAVGVLHLSPVSSNSAATGFRKALGIEGLHPFKPCFCSLRTDAHWRFEVN